MKYLIFFLILYSCKGFAIANYESGAIGCRGISQSFKTKIQSSVYILKSFQVGLSAHEQELTINDHIEKQIKYLIGISKEYRSVQVAKFAFSAFRNKFQILNKKAEQVQLPELNQFWGPNISLGDSPYVKELVRHSQQSVGVDKITYQTDIILTTCGIVPLSTSTVFDEFEKLFYPLDPYLGFWINQPNERKTITAKNRKRGVVPDCLSQDFLIFGTAPEYGWFYWEPIHRDTSRLCRIENKNLTTNLKIETLEVVSLNKQTEIFSTDGSGEIAIAAAFGQVNHSDYKLAKNYDVLFDEIQSIFNQCQGQKSERMACFSELDRYLKGIQVELDPGQRSLIYVLKFYSAMVINHKISPEKISEKYLRFKMTGESVVNKKKITFSIYAGPTGVFQSYLAPTDYWNFVQESFYQDDLFLYFGHAGVGNNLAFKSVLDRSSLKPTSFKKRTRDLNLGIFNCEAYSYFGWDLNSIFENKSASKHSVNMVASSGVEVSSSFLSAYIENILKSEGLKAEAMIENFSGYVLSNDFLTFQKIQAD